MTGSCHFLRAPLSGCGLRCSRPERAAALGTAPVAAERLAVAAAAVAATDRLGYRVQRVDGTDVSGVAAWRGHELMLLAIGDGVKVDHAGLADGSCVDRRAALVEQLSRRGWS